MTRQPTTRQCNAHHQHGQALVELLVISVALVPLFLLLPMVGKYQDLSHAAQTASRYVAFEATTRNDTQSVDGWKPPAQLADEVRRRFFGNTDAPVKTGDTAGDFDANRNPLWSDPFGNPLIRQFSDVAVSFGQNATDHAGAFTGASDGAPFNVVPLANASRMGLQSPGIYTGHVSANLANLPSGIKSIVPFDTLDLSIQRHTSLVFDGWGARSPQQAEDRFGNLVAALGPLQAVQSILDYAIGALEFFNVDAPQFGNLQLWRDVVPADRLAAP
jgi:hypothetical protein